MNALITAIRDGRLTGLDAVAALTIPEQIAVNERAYSLCSPREQVRYNVAFECVQDSAKMLALALELLAFTDDEITRFCAAAQQDGYLHAVEMAARLEVPG
jgi:hypothetical protein